MDADDGQKPILLPIAAVLYGIGMLILLSPVRSELPYSGQMSGTGGSSICGLTLTAAFMNPVEEADESERKADCAAQAGDRVGYGLLALVLAAPFAVTGAVQRHECSSRSSRSRR